MSRASIGRREREDETSIREFPPSGRIDGFHHLVTASPQGGPHAPGKRGSNAAWFSVNYRRASRRRSVHTDGRNRGIKKNTNIRHESQD